MGRFSWWAAAAALAGAIGCGGAGGAGPVQRVTEAKGAVVQERRAAEGAAPVLSALLPAPEERIPVPGFDGATAWLNVDRPLSIEDLRGRVVIVDFWTSCCINCLQTMPTLRALEERFANEPVVVIGVHAPKFDEEQEVDRLRDVLRDNRVAHPIAVDADMVVWRAWGVEAWPTLAVLDPSGKALWAGSGEPDGDALGAIVEAVLAEGRAKGTLAKGPLAGVRPERETAGALRYPGKVLALAGGGLAIADTGHDRVVLLDRSGAVEAVVGSGLAGRADGAFEEARFRRPQGMAEVEGDLYVADTGGHAIRKIDRKARAVTTIAGTGEIGPRALGVEERPARAVALRSPWDVLHRNGTLYVALAGSHQVGAIDLRRGTLRLFAGSGREARIDGEWMEAAFAQPSALATDGRELFVLDSETSSVRAIDFRQGTVRTVVGKDLFVFGDRDGDRETARLQHPIGMAYGEGALWVADTYNSKLRRVDPATGATRTVLGGGALAEPAGLAVSGGAAWIADTNHHRVMRFPLRGGAAAPVAVAGLAPPEAYAASPGDAAAAAAAPAAK